MTKYFKYRIYPTKKQEKLLETTIYTCRTLYNHALQGLEVRTHNCPHCGLAMDRDLNASKNILSRAGRARIDAFGDSTSTLKHASVFGQVESMN